MVRPQGVVGADGGSEHNLTQVPSDGIICNEWEGDIGPPFPGSKPASEILCGSR
jgi:hypothetical protein